MLKIVKLNVAGSYIKPTFVQNLERMQLEIFKYQGAGNDFIFLDNFSGKYDDLTLSQIQFLCDRRFGVGADGLIKIDRSEEWDFHLDYFNSDGSKSFCGNGARCAVRFVHDQILKKDVYTFMAFDGVHQGQLLEQNVAIDMKDVNKVEHIGDVSFVLNTGSPHYIHFVDSLTKHNIVEFGKKIRYSDRYTAEGINVNLVEITAENSLKIRTYERGVEDETLACGTGITAAAIAYAVLQKKEADVKVSIKAKGGDLRVSFYVAEEGSFKAIKLIGPAEFVFKGSVDV